MYQGYIYICKVQVLFVHFFIILMLQKLKAIYLLKYRNKITNPAYTSQSVVNFLNNGFQTELKTEF